MHAIFTKHFDIYIIFTNNKSKLETFTMKNFISILLLSVFSFHPILAQEEGAIRNYIQIGKSDGISNNNIRSVQDDIYNLSLIHISEPTRLMCLSRMPSSA